MSIRPCDSEGALLKNEHFIDNTDELLDQRLDFKVVISTGTWPKRYNQVFCKYTVRPDESVTTGVLSEASNDFEHTEHVTIEKCTEKILESIKTKALVIKVRGRQIANLSKPINNAAKQGKTTRQIRKIEQLAGRKKSSRPRYDGATFQMTVQYLIAQKKKMMLEERLLRIKALCDDAEANGGAEISVVETRKHLGYIGKIGWPMGKGKTFLKTREKSGAEVDKESTKDATKEATDEQPTRVSAKDVSPSPKREEGSKDSSVCVIS